MKTPYFTGAFTAAQHTDVQGDDQLRERMLEYRLASRDDVREIFVVTVPVNDYLSTSAGRNVVEQASERSKTELSWAMHWAIEVGDQYFELQRAYYDPTRTGLRMSRWDKEKKDKIHRRYRQGTTAMTDDEIRDIGIKHFSRLDKMHINKYDVWCNNCQVVVDRMLRDIGGLDYYRSKLKSLHEWIRQFFCNSIMSIVQFYYRLRKCERAEELLIKHEKVLRNAVYMMTARSIHYPKKRWIKEDIQAAEGIVKKIGTVTDHWFLTVLESSLSLRQGTKNSYVRRGPDGKAELNFDAVRDAVKGIFDDVNKSAVESWFKAVPWLTAGFLVGTTNWAVAVISIAVSYVSNLTENRKGMKGGLEESLGGLGISPKLQDAEFLSITPSRPRARRIKSSDWRVKRAKTKSIDDKLVARYERCSTFTGVPYFLDLMNQTRSWEPPDQQELCLKITNPPLSKKWEERQEDGRVFYVNRITEERIDNRPGAAEIWVVKKLVSPDWPRSSIMALPYGWEMCRTEEGEKYYVNHKEDPPMLTEIHPMRQEIEEERKRILPEWNIEWDEDRGKKYRNLQNGEVRWKAVNGPQYVPADSKAKTVSREPSQGFIEPLPLGWTSIVGANEQKLYVHTKTGEKIFDHPLAEKRRRLLPEWEMRYTAYGLRYWVHYGPDGRGTTWWKRNKVLKNTSLKNDACGWKLSKTGRDWIWFEGGDVTRSNSEIPVLDLDDPAEIEFREYPFILPPRLTNDVGSFAEPLPQDWVRRTHQRGDTYFWNFKTENRSDAHPCEEERESLPALWEMRYTLHGRPYYLRHDDGSTFWTNPRSRAGKNEQKLRALPGQRQDGWKIGEDGIWERFTEGTDARKAEQSALANGNGEEGDRWRSFASTKSWLKYAGEREFVAQARGKVDERLRRFRRGRGSSGGSSEKVTGESPEIFFEEPEEFEKDQEVFVKEPEEIGGSQSGWESEASQDQEASQPENPRKKWTKSKSTLSLLSKMGEKGRKGVETYIKRLDPKEMDIVSRQTAKEALEPGEDDLKSKEQIRGSEREMSVDALGLSGTETFESGAIVASPTEEGDGEKLLGIVEEHTKDEKKMMEWLEKSVHEKRVKTLEEIPEEKIKGGA